MYIVERNAAENRKVGAVYALRNTVLQSCSQLVDGPESSKSRDDDCERYELLGSVCTATCPSFLTGLGD